MRIAIMLLWCVGFIWAAIEQRGALVLVAALNLIALGIGVAIRER